MTSFLYKDLVALDKITDHKHGTWITLINLTFVSMTSDPTLPKVTQKLYFEGRELWFSLGLILKVCERRDIKVRGGGPRYEASAVIPALKIRDLSPPIKPLTTAHRLAAVTPTKAFLSQRLWSSSLLWISLKSYKLGAKSISFPSTGEQKGLAWGNHFHFACQKPRESHRYESIRPVHCYFGHVFLHWIVVNVDTDGK